MIYTVTLNPALDKTATVENLRLDSVNRISELRVDPGGKGINVSKVVRELGAKTVAIALLGGHTGTMLRNMLVELGIECKVLEVEGETRTNLKIKDPALKTNTDINEPGPEVTDEQLRRMLDGLVGEVGSGDIVVLSGSLPRGAAADTYKVWVAALKKTGAKVYLDADGDKLVRGIEAKPDLIKPNEIELGAMMGRTLDADDKIVEAARELIDGGLDRVMVSMGGAGALYVARDVTIKANPVKVPVGSTVGAGDSVVAALAYAQDKGLSLEDTMRLAMATGAANVMQSGTQAAPRELVDSLIDKAVVTKL